MEADALAPCTRARSLCVWSLGSRLNTPTPQPTRTQSGSGSGITPRLGAPSNAPSEGALRLIRRASSGLASKRSHSLTLTVPVWADFGAWTCRTLREARHRARTRQQAHPAKTEPPNGLPHEPLRPAQGQARAASRRQTGHSRDCFVVTAYAPRTVELRRSIRSSTW